jgi:hypothetical protein
VHAVDGGDTHTETPPNPSRAAALDGLAARMSTMGTCGGEPQRLPGDGDGVVAHSVPLRGERVKPAAAASAARRAAPQRSRMPRRPEWVDVEIPCAAVPDVMEVTLLCHPPWGGRGWRPTLTGLGNCTSLGRFTLKHPRAWKFALSLQLDGFGDAETLPSERFSQPLPTSPRSM